MKIALITGATSGIGRATAKLLAQNDFNLIITGRRENRLSELKKLIETSGKIKVKTLCFDIRVSEQVTQALKSLPEEWKKIDILVNNAGLAVGADTIDKGELQDWEQMIDTNIKGLLFVSKIVIDWMKARKTGQIINIGSVAGKDVYPGGNVYCSTKFAVDALTKAMRIDLLKFGIRVSSIDPGAVDTEFSLVRYKGNKQKAKDVYKGFVPLYEEDVAEAILFAVTRPPHVCVNDMVITSTAQANALFIEKK